jgi:hypothetical protein
VAIQELRIERSEVELPARRIDEGGPIGVRIVAELVLDPPDGLLDRGFTLRHTILHSVHMIDRGRPGT